MIQDSEHWVSKLISLKELKYLEMIFSSRHVYTILTWYCIGFNDEPDQNDNNNDN